MAVVKGVTMVTSGSTAPLSFSLRYDFKRRSIGHADLPAALCLVTVTACMTIDSLSIVRFVMA